MSGLRNILIEGRIEDAKNLIRKHYLVDEESSDYMYLVDYLVDKDPSGNNKYLMWMVKRMVDDNEETHHNTEGALIELVTDFHELLPKISNALAVKVFGADSDISISPKSIDSYDNTQTLYKIVDAAREHESRKQVEVQAKSGADKIYDDERWMVIRPATKEASCYYGAGTKWCTAMKNENHFDKYTSTGRLYYLIDKSRKLGKYYKIALYKPFVGDVGDEWYDEKDNRIEGEIYEVVSSLLPQAAHDEIEKDFQKELDNAYDQHSSPTQFAENFVEWVKRKYPHAKIIESLSGPWNMQPFSGPGYDHPYISLSSRKFEGFVNVSIFDDDDYVRIDMDTELNNEYGSPTPINLGINADDFEKYFWNFDMEVGTDSDYQLFYRQLIWLIEKEFIDNPAFVKAIDLDKKYWKHYGYSGQSLKFHYPPRKGTMTQLFTDYVIKNPGKTRQEFYREVLEREHTRGHNTTFFGGLLSSGIVRGERGGGRGRAMKFYKGPNYDAWIKGNLKRI